jgi:hypothetical protein
MYVLLEGDVVLLDVLGLQHGDHVLLVIVEEDLEALAFANRASPLTVRGLEGHLHHVLEREALHVRADVAPTMNNQVIPRWRLDTLHRERAGQ